MEILSTIDQNIFLAINGIAGQSERLDRVVAMIRWSPLFKAVPLLMILAYLWFSLNSSPRRKNKIIATGILVCVSLILARILSVVLPFRLRPIHQDEVAVNIASGLNVETLSGWSSMPSDHAAMYVTLATAIFLISKPAGIFAFIQTAVLVLLPRVFLGLHWPSDIIVGSLVGLVICVAFMGPLARLINRLGAFKFCETRPGLSAAIGFFVAFNLSTNFSWLRILVALIRDLARM